MNTTPSGGDQEVGITVFVHVPHGHGIKPERISWNSAGEGFDEISAFAGIQEGAPAADGFFAVLPGARQSDRRYLGRYTHRVAISNHRLLTFEHNSRR